MIATLHERGRSFRDITFCRFRLVGFAIASLFFSSMAPQAQATEITFTELKLSSGEKIQTYIHINSERFDPSKILLALPPGGQNRAMVKEGINDWRHDFISAGWSIISPAAPPGRSFSGANLSLIPEVLDSIRKTKGITFDKVYLFGISNGGISALEAAAQYPQLFHSVTVLPGMLHSTQQIDALTILPVNMMVGGKDGYWTTSSRQLVQKISSRGGDANLTIITGAGHYAFHKVSYELLLSQITR